MNTMLMEKAAQLTILDAIENGHTDKDELMAYMQSETFRESTDRYYDMLSKLANRF